jgi:SPP1 family predicted phage head-tail adaptor
VLIHERTSGGRSGAGKYNRRIAIEQPSLSTAADGSRSKEYVPYGKFWGAIVPLGGGEDFEHERNQAEQTYRLELRSTPDTRAITTVMRAVLPNGPRVNIAQAIDVQDARQEVHLTTMKTKR